MTGRTLKTITINIGKADAEAYVQACKKIEEEKAVQPLYSALEKALLDILQICQGSKMEPHDVRRVDQLVRAALTCEERA